MTVGVYNFRLIGIYKKKEHSFVHLEHFCHTHISSFVCTQTEHIRWADVEGCPWADALMIQCYPPPNLDGFYYSINCL